MHKSFKTYCFNRICCSVCLAVTLLFIMCSKLEFMFTSLTKTNLSAMETSLNLLLPYNTNPYACYQIPHKQHLYSKDYLRQKDRFDKEVERATDGRMEGNSGDTIMQSQYRFYYQLGQQPWVKIICETGFNAGHDAFQWLASSDESTTLYSFDICKYGYTSKMAGYLLNHFPGRLYVKCGDSMETLPTSSHLNGLCDVIVVDGGHTMKNALSDLHNFYQLANPQNHILIIDDVPLNKDVTLAWNRAKKEGLVRELFQCGMKPSRGFAVGIYNTTMSNES